MESVAKTWMVSFESIRRLHPRAADLLLLMSCFDRHSIPSALVQKDEDDVLDFEEAIAVLCAFSFIESDEEETKFEMHNLVQLAAKLWMAEEDEKGHWAFEGLTSLAHKFPAPTHHPTQEHRTACALFLPHAQLSLAHLFKAQHEKVELARATLLLSVARFVHNQGAYTESVVRTEESLDIRKRNLGLRHHSSLQALGQLA